MSQDFRLEITKDKLIVAIITEGPGSEAYRDAFQHYLRAFKVTAIEYGEGALNYEDPYESIVYAIEEGDDPETLKRLLDEYRQMVEALEEIGYREAPRWRTTYEECVARCVLEEVKV